MSLYFVVESTAVVKRWNAFVPLAILAVVGGGGVYMWAVCLCFRAERRLREEVKGTATSIEISRKVLIGRLVTIAIFHILAISVTMVAWLWIKS